MAEYIDKQQAINVIDAWESAYSWNEWCYQNKDEKDFHIYAPSSEIEKLTPVTVPEWISVKDRLPEEDKNVLISYRYKEGEGDTSHVYIDITNYGQLYFGSRKIGDNKYWRSPFEFFGRDYEVIAWMPLPEPYNPKDDA